jgi:oligoendopeptidase F
MQKQLTRAEVSVAETWSLEDLFPSEAAWEAELSAVEAAIPSVTQYRGRLGEGAQVLLACLDAQEALMVRLMRVGTYASLRLSEDGTSPANQSLQARAGALGAKVGAAIAFIRPEVLALPEGAVERCLDLEPGLAPHRHYLEEWQEYRPHTLSAETESALASLSEVLHAPYTVYIRSRSSDMQFDPVQDGQGRQVPNSFNLYESGYEGHADTVLRRNAFAGFIGTLKKYQNTLAATFATEVKRNVVLAKLRGYESAEQMLIKPHRIPFLVYENVLDIIQQELAPHFRRYMRLRKRVVGLDTLYYCDLKAPLDPAYNPKVTWEESSETILQALSILGGEYNRIMRNCVKERWTDRADNIGKSGGAFCSSPYGVHPYILITWQDTVRNMFTMAHELGHAGHFGLAMNYQRYVGTRPSMFFVEAPSTCNEMILADYILGRTQEKRMRRAVIEGMLGTFHHNYVTHLLEAELQRRVYRMAEKGTPVTAPLLSQTKGEILARFWGDVLEIDDGARLTWIRQPHYYMGLYPYTYAAGLTCSVAVAERIREEGQPAVERWLQALKAGGTLKPMELMALAGVDMMDPNTIRRAVAYVGSLIDELEQSY